MPFESKAQQRWMYANHPSMAKRWADHTPNIKKLQEKKMQKKSAVQRMGEFLRKESSEVCSTPGEKIRSEGKGRGKAVGKGKGPLGRLRGLKIKKEGMLTAQEPNLGTPDPTGGTQMSTTAAQMSNAQNLTPKLNIPKSPEQSSGGILGKQGMAAAPAKNTSSIPYREDGDAAHTPSNAMNIVEGQESPFSSTDSLQDDRTLETMDPSTPALPDPDGEYSMYNVTKVSGNELEDLITQLGTSNEKVAGISPKTFKSLFSAGSSLGSYHGTQKKKKVSRKKGMLTKVSEGSGPLDEIKSRHMEESHEQKMRHTEEVHQLKVQNMAQSQAEGEEGVAAQPPAPAPLEPEHEQSVLQTALENLKNKQVQMGPL